MIIPSIGALCPMPKPYSQALINYATITPFRNQERKMKQLMTFFAAVSFLLLSTAGFADAPKIGVVDLQKIMQTSPKMKEIQQRLEKDFMPRRDKLITMEEQLKSDMEKLKRDSAVMSEAQKKELQSKIMTNKQALDKEGQAYQQELSTEHNKAVQGLYEKVKAVIDQVAKEKKYSLVIQKEAAPYSDNQLEITDLVMKKLK